MASAICPESKKPLAQIWATPDLLQEEWFPLFFRCQLKCFTDEKVSGPKEREAMKDFISKNLAERQEILENLYPKELAIFYLYGSGLETSKYYCDLTFKSIFNDWAATSYLMKNRRRSLLQSLQGLSEVVSFLSIAMASSLEIQREGFLRLIERFSIRTPDIQKDPSPMWDEMLEYRSFFVHFMKSQWKDMNDTVSQRCQEAEFNFRLAFSESAAQQRNFEVALRELFICKGELWPSVSDPIAQMRFAEIYSKTHQLRARWGDPIRSSLGLITAIELLEKTPVNDDLRPIHVMLKGSNFESLSDACLREEFKLTTLTDNQKKRLFQLAGKGCETLSAARESFLTQSYNLYSQACVVELSTHFSFDRQKKFDNVHMTLADLCDKVLRSREDNLSTYSQLDVTEYPKALVNGILTAMKNGCEVAREKFARLLQIIELYPNCGDLFKERSAEVPSWMFLSWTPQIFALLDKPEAPLLQDIVWQLVNTYPNALIYPMKLSQENYNFTNDERGRKSRQFVDEIDTVFSKFPLIDKFISALEQLHQPDMIFKEICAKLEKLLKQSDKKEFICRFNDEMEKIFPKEDTHRSDSNRLPVGSYMSDFAKRQRSEFEKRFAVKQLKEMGLTEFNKAVSHVAIRPGEPPTTLRSYSPWLADFTPRKHNELELEIPGQYSGKRKPMPEYHVKISGFSDEITVMDSMRKPKSLTIRGNNEREYKFLVKCGEDLRQDQRLEQVFETINGILARDHLCRQRQLALRTYSVVPLTPRLGLIEFIPNVVGLKEFMLANPDFPYSDAARSKRFGYVRQYIDWPEDSRKFGDAYLKSYGKNEPQKVAEIFRKIEALVPDDSLSRSFLNLSASNEAFFILRNNFARTHAVLCVVHYLLGIGDRHLSNFLIDTTTGEIIGIDFGYAFGVSIQLIGVGFN